MVTGLRIAAFVGVGLLAVSCGADDCVDATVPLDALAGECTVVTYTPPTSGSAMRAMLCRPPEGEERFGGMVLVHGGGGNSGDPADVASWEVAYRDAGMTTLSIEYLLHDPESGSATWPIPESNVKAAVQFMRLHADELALEDAQVLLHGFSAGARLGGIVATTPGSSEFESAELWPGVSDDVTSFIGFYGYYDGQQFEGDTYYADGAIPQAAVAMDHADAMTGPVQLTHGDTDPIVPAQQSVDFAAALEDADKEVNLTIVDDASTHVFDGYGEADITPKGEAAATEMIDWYESLIAGDS